MECKCMNFIDRYFWPVLIVLAIFLLGMGLAPWAHGATEITASFSRTDDGGCAKVANAASLDYRYTADDRLIRANVRSAPSGGDCEQLSTAYSASVEQQIGEVWGVEPFIKVFISEQPTAAQYALAVDGQVLTRGDGGPLHAPILPAGVARTLEAAVGVTREQEWAGFQTKTSVGFNTVPVDWSDGSAGRTGYVSAVVSRWNLSAETQTSFGSDVYGTFAVRYTAGPLVAAWRLVYGLDALAAGMPMSQEVAGAQFVLVGDPKEMRDIFEVGLRWRI